MRTSCRRPATTWCCSLLRGTAVLCRCAASRRVGAATALEQWGRARALAAGTRRWIRTRLRSPAAVPVCAEDLGDQSFQELDVRVRPQVDTVDMSLCGAEVVRALVDFAQDALRVVEAPAVDAKDRVVQRCGVVDGKRLELSEARLEEGSPGMDAASSATTRRCQRRRPRKLLRQPTRARTPNRRREPPTIQS